MKDGFFTEELKTVPVHMTNIYFLRGGDIPSSASESVTEHYSRKSSTHHYPRKSARIANKKKLLAREECRMKSREAAIKKNSWILEDDEEDSDDVVMMKPANIGVVGMSQVFSPGNRAITRMWWSLVLLFLSGLFITQFTDRLSHYLSNPVKVTMKIKRAWEMTFPTVTICYREFYNPKRAKPYEERVAKTLGLKESEVTLGHLMTQFDPTELWLDIGFQVEDIFDQCYFGRNSSCKSQGEFIPVLTVMGLCYKYKLRDKVSNSGCFNNYYTKLNNPKYPYREDDGWKLFLGDEKDTPALRITTSSMTIYPGWEPDVQVMVKEFKTLPTAEDPCVEHPNYTELDCELDCFQNTFRDYGGCWLPFMTQKSQDMLPSCNTAQDFNKSMSLVQSLLYNGNWTREGCGCMSACEDVHYEAFSDSREQGKEEGVSTTRLRIFYNDLTYQAVHEEWAYNLISFMCDVGGALGLLLGASVLTFIEILECVFACCFKACHRKEP